ncbi:hypothetical protein DITRI_Ditri05aG0102900 [Diplodiscus trichospermus]
MWLKHGDFLQVVKDSYIQKIFGNPLQRLVHKLKRLKTALKLWNKNLFRDIHEKVKEFQHRLEAVQKRILEDPSDHLIRVETAISTSLGEALLQQERFFKEQSQIKWLKEGDSNTELFHKVVNMRKALKGISFLKINDNLVFHPDEN